MIRAFVLLTALCLGLTACGAGSSSDALPSSVPARILDLNDPAQVAEFTKFTNESCEQYSQTPLSDPAVGRYLGESMIEYGAVTAHGLVDEVNTLNTLQGGQMIFGLVIDNPQLPLGGSGFVCRVDDDDCSSVREGDTVRVVAEPQWIDENALGQTIELARYVVNSVEIN